MRLSGAIAIFSDRCRSRLDEAKLGGEFATEVEFLRERGHGDERSLTRGESEDGSKSRFQISMTRPHRCSTGRIEPPTELCNEVEIDAYWIKISVMIE